MAVKSITLPKGIKIDDSKKLTRKQREKSAQWIKQNALMWGIGQASAKYIDKFGITKAENFAFRKAIKAAQEVSGVKIDLVMIDAFYIPRLKGLPMQKQFAFKKGDRKSMNIAAASIIAKVARDQFMAKLSQQARYIPYRWDQNKGYGTKSHIAAITKYGKSDLHRKLFLKKL